MPTFEIGATDFLLDGQPHRILSGALHYFRVHPDQWEDRIIKARLMGLNTIETYVAWNAHEPTRGNWNSTGWNDLGRFLDLIADAGMHAIVRPGPYICAEWHNGGLPVWLTSQEGITLRRSDPTYLSDVDTYLRRVYEIVAPRQINAGGNVVLVQIENEYGAYGADKAYLTELVRITRDAGITVPLTTIDQPQPRMLRDGSLTGLHLTASFGSHAAERLDTLRKFQPTGPLMCAEFWDGWFDWWGGHHHTTSAAESATELEVLLGAGASVNFYMFHGGTNYGLTNGANDKGRYRPLVTSYDYSAPLDEAGNPTEKYWAYRDVISRFAPIPDQTPATAPTPPAFAVEMHSIGDWTSAPLYRSEASAALPTFEDLAHLGPLVRYQTEIPQGSGLRRLEVAEVRDRAWVELDGRPVGRLSRVDSETSLALPAGRQLRVLVEERGRVNYEKRLGEAKGLIGPATLDGQTLNDWEVTTIDIPDIVEWAKHASASSTSVGRVALRGVFDRDEPSDLLLDTSGWGSGYALLNGFILGRYDRTGPQRTLYIPAPVIRTGPNTLLIIELDDAPSPVARFVSHAWLGPLEE